METVITWTLAQTAKAVGWHPSTLYKKCQAKLINSKCYQKLGKKYVFFPDEINKAIRTSVFYFPA